MGRLAIFSLFLLIGCPQAPVEPPATDGGMDLPDSGPPAVDAGFQAPNPCGCAEVQTCVWVLDCLEPEICEEDSDCIGERICVQGSCYDCWGARRVH